MFNKKLMVVTSFGNNATSIVRVIDGYRSMSCAHYTSCNNPGYLNGIGLVVFTGGHDVHPSIYGKPKLCNTGNVLERDRAELMLFRRCVKAGIPMLGICRGAQLLNVANGGTLIQDVDGHTADHYIATSDGQRIKVTSTHHQMMVPSQTKEYELLAWAGGLSTRYLYSKDSDSNHAPLDKLHRHSVQYKEPEVILYKDTKSLCVQYHPEYMQTHEPAVRYLNHLLKTHFAGDN